MQALSLIGIGTGNPQHLTREAVEAIRQADLVLLPHKGEAKAELAHVRMAILQECGVDDAKIAHFDMPLRRQDDGDYPQQVNEWHDAIAARWQACASRHLPQGAGRVALLVWGDPALYDSTLRIARRLGLQPDQVQMIPGISSMQLLCSAHGIAFNGIGEPFLVTTGRRLREQGWPVDIGSVIVMLDGHCAFDVITEDGVQIYWGAYLGMPQQMLISGPLARVRAEIRTQLEQARQAHGWIMDTYLLRRHGGADGVEMKVPT